MARADRFGYGISAALHLGVIGWVLLGGSWFKPKPSEPIVLSEVAVISEAEFAAMMAAAPAPAETEPAQPETPAVQPEPVAPPEPVQEVAPEPIPEPLPTPEPPEPQPDLTDLTEPPEPAEVVELPPTMMPPVEVPQDTIAPEFSPRPVPKPAPRVAPKPAEAPEPDAKVSDLAKPETRAEAEAPEPEPVETQDEAAPPEATTEIVTEATETEEVAKTSAPKSSVRPRAKPAKPAPAPKTEAKTESAASAKSDAPKPDAPKRDAVQDALAEAMREAEGTGTGGNGRAPAGPPVTAGEKEALIVDVKACWNVGALSSEALRTSVTVAVDMGSDGKPDIGSIRMLGYEGGSEAAAKQAYEAGRRAIVRCGSDGFPLPPEKYDHWRQIEIVFNPEKMRMK
ncbi:MAG: hypothetical protein R3D78_03495 [Paracoccaceae bacterium]